MDRDTVAALIPDYGAVTPARIDDEVRAAIAQADDLVAQVAASADSPRALVDGLDAAERLVTERTTPLVALVIIHPDRGVRMAAGEAEERVARWRLDVVRRPAVADAILAWGAGTAEADLPVEYAAALAGWTRDVRLGGAHLPPVSQAQLRDIHERLAGLAARFDANVTDATIRLTLTTEELQGVPAAFLASLPRGEDGTYDVNIDNSTAIALLESVQWRDVRERIDRAFLARAADANAALIAEAVALRSQAARLLGYETWLDLRAQSLVARDASVIHKFLADIEPPLRAAAAVEREQMANELEVELGERIAVADWDWRYVDARQRARLGIDQDGLREYLPLDAVLEGMFALAEEVFGVRVQLTGDVAAWHPDVRRLELTDVHTGELLDVCLLDPYARDGKMSNAFMWTLIPGRVTRHGRQPGLSTLVTSLPRPADGRESLLGADDVDALFHEFGHVLDFALASNAILPRPSWAQRDWTEAPSQFLGRWALHPDVLRRYARHYRSGAEIPDALAAGLHASLDLNAATRALRLLSLAKLDVAFHTASAQTRVDVRDIDRDAFEARGFSPVDGALFAAAFSHPWAGYDGACYGFLWAQVLLSEIFAAFVREGVTAPVIGASYRRQILELGWSDDPVAAVTRFLGREPSTEPFVRRLAADRPPSAGAAG